MSEAKSSVENLHVVLIGNYLHDRQESMQRFAALARRNCESQGIAQSMLVPPARLGALKPGAEGLGKWLGYIDKFLLFPKKLQQEIHRIRQSGKEVVVHICDHSNSFYVRSLAGIPHLVTCHDLLAVRLARGEFPPRKTSFTGQVLQSLILSGVRAARKVVCVSESTRTDLLRLTGKSKQDVQVIYNDLNYDYAPMPREEAQSQISILLPQCKARALGETFLLHVGGNQWYKNRVGVLQLYAQLLAAWSQHDATIPKLLMIGPPPTSEMRKLVQDKHLEAHVSLIPPVDSATLCALYSQARVLLFPSHAEGFGWPIIEAQACGCAVATTDEPPMTEIGGEAAIYLRSSLGSSRPAQAVLQENASRMRALLAEDPASRQQRRVCGLQNAARFSDSRMKDAYLSCYAELALSAPALGCC